ncbi:MAG: large subunit ribosomal protein L38e [Thermoproteota archaeon]|nr:large subunit ribosomal protein L38e [Thermoproteota archaeon]
MDILYYNGVISMPNEIVDIEEFVRLSEKAEECRIKRLKDTIKLKIKTSSRLYTIKLEKEKADPLIKRLKCKTTEV